MAKERTEKYWICDTCADEKQWKPPKWAVTCIMGLCGWCDRKTKTMLTPVVDFDRGPGKRPVWD